MPCTRTGCHIYIQQYGEYAYGDAFEIETGDGLPFHAPICYFRIVESAPTPLRNSLHYTVLSVENWFDRGTDMQTLIASSAINHGYEGKPL